MPNETDGRYRQRQALTIGEIDRLMEAVNAVPVLRDPHQRQLVLDELRDEYGSQFDPARHGDAKVDTWALVSTCIRIGGMSTLVTILRMIGGEAIEWRRLNELVSALFPIESVAAQLAPARADAALDEQIRRLLVTVSDDVVADALRHDIFEKPILSSGRTKNAEDIYTALLVGKNAVPLLTYLERVAHRLPEYEMVELHRRIEELAQRLNLTHIIPEVCRGSTKHDLLSLDVHHRASEMSNSTQPHTRKAIRMGFMLDVVDYGGRDSPAKENVQQRLADAVRFVLEEMYVSMSNTERQGTGDGMVVILPEMLDIQRGLAVLLRSFDERLIHDNGVFRDRMRVRMAADVGPVSSTELGFGGAMVTNMGRMLNSKRLRRAVTDHPGRDLFVIVSDPLHRFVVAEGVPGLPTTQFTRVQVRAKELATTAWLWTR